MARTLHVQLDNRLRCRIGDIPDEADDAVIDALIIPNLEKQRALEQFVTGAEEMDDEIVMYDLSGPRTEDAIIDMPRGFAVDLVDGMEAFGVEVVFDDRRAKPTKFRIGDKIERREHQEPAVRDMLDHQQGIYKAPPGAGKTVVVLAAGRKAGTQCLIIVDKKHLVTQWVNRIHEHLSPTIEVGIIGDNKLDIRPYWNVAIAQTIHSRFDELEEMGFFDTFGFVCLDECHHATAETYSRVMDRFSSYYRFGVSATPAKTGDFQLAQLVLGPVFHTTGHKELVERGYLMKPEIVRVKTNFGFNFRGTTSRHSRSNYPEMVQALIENRERNKAIVEIIMRESGHHMLVLTKRHEHIDILDAMLATAGYEFPIERLTGKEGTKERARIIGMLETEPCCVFSTVADEALDVPRVDRGILAFPQRNEGLIEQQIGRYARTHPDKKSARVYDIADVKIGAFKAQWRVRWMKVYKKLGLKVTKISVDELLQRGVIE